MSDWAAGPAPLARRLLTVLGVEQLGAYRVLRVADVETPEPRPGQFAMLAAAERWGGGADERPYLRARLLDRPPTRRRVAVPARGRRPGHASGCASCARATGLWALGPLGKGFAPPSERRRAILVGGGVGIAPLAILQDALEAEAEREVTVLLGFRDAARAEGAALLRGAQVATDDGSVGHHGLRHRSALDGARPRLARTVYACGPAPMLEAVRAMCATRGVPAQLALEAGMACGFGACFGCVVPKRGGGYLRVCLDGPVIDAAELEHVDAHAGAPA